MAPVTVAIVTRRLRQGKSYEDFRKAWYHTVGFGVANTMLTVLNAADPREIIVIGLTEASEQQASELVAIDAAERESNPLDEVIEPQIERTFGVLIAEDDFSGSGTIDYQPAMVNGVETNLDQVAAHIARAAPLLARLRKGSRQAGL
jgi:hypothetical protein